jgi:uncharacterized damage-inducible protein DinB
MIDQRLHLLRNVAFNAWANRVMLNTARQLTPAVLHQKQPMGFGTIFETLVHLMDAQHTWIERWQGRQVSGRVEPSTIADLDVLERAFDQVTAEVEAYLNNADLSATITYRTTSGETFTHPIGMLAWHVLNHGVEHRSELAAMFTQAGISPDRVDLIHYMRTVENDVEKH